MGTYGKIAYIFLSILALIIILFTFDQLRTQFSGNAFSFLATFTLVLVAGVIYKVRTEL